MNNERFENILSARFSKCVALLNHKAGEYATEDRLHNFKVAAKLQNCTPITALAGMMSKHTVSVYDLIQRQEAGISVPKEMWEEKIGDSLNYLILLTALIEEKFDEECSCAGECCKAKPSADVEGLIDYIKQESERLEDIKVVVRNADADDSYKTGYAAGKCAGAKEIARTVSLYLAIDKE